MHGIGGGEGLGGPSKNTVGVGSGRRARTSRERRHGMRREQDCPTRPAVAVVAIAASATVVWKVYLSQPLIWSPRAHAPRTVLLRRTGCCWWGQHALEKAITLQVGPSLPTTPSNLHACVLASDHTATRLPRTDAPALFSQLGCTSSSFLPLASSHARGPRRKSGGDSEDRGSSGGWSVPRA